MTLLDAIELTSKLISLAIFVNAAEIIYLYSKKYYHTGGIFDWNLNQAILGSRAKYIHWIFKHQSSILILNALRIVSAVIVIFSSFDSPYFTAGIVILCVTQLILNIRSIFGDDGSDQMVTVVIVAVTIASIFSSNIYIITLCIIFVALQSILSYSCSGLAKLFGTKWRNGSAFNDIMNNCTYGNNNIFSLLKKYPLIGAFIGWSVMAFQIVFPAIVLVDQNYILFFLIVGFLFHFSISIVMRLNGFLFAFPAAYPALYFFCSESKTIFSGFNNVI